MDKAWLVNATYDAGRVTLTFLRNDTLHPFTWSDTKYQPYYLTENQHQSTNVKKIDLFPGQARSLAKIEYSTRPGKRHRGMGSRHCYRPQLRVRQKIEWSLSYNWPDVPPQSSGATSVIDWENIHT